MDMNMNLDMNTSVLDLNAYPITGPPTGSRSAASMNLATADTDTSSDKRRRA